MCSTDTPIEFETLLEHLGRSRGFDFTGHKPASLMLRTTKRMQDIGLAEYGIYQDSLWGLHGNGVVGKHFLNLDMGLPVEQLGRPLRACLSEDVVQTTTTLDATNRPGKPITCDVTCMELVGPRTEVRGAILIMESCDGASPPRNT